MEERCEVVRTPLLVFADRRTRSVRSWLAGFHARKAVEQLGSDSHKLDKGPILVLVVSRSSHSPRDQAPRRKHRMLPSAGPAFYCKCTRIRNYGLMMALSSL
jgi:hypothetical protein